MSTASNLTYVIAGVAVTALLLAASIYLRNEDRAFRETAVRAEATVVARADTHWRDNNGDDQYEKYDVYQLTTATGEAVRFNSPISATQPRREIGARAMALYAPGAPSNARLDDESRGLMSRILLWCSPIGLAFSAVFFLIGARSRRARLERASS